MHNQGYYRIHGAKENDVSDNSAYLRVNCTGACVIPQPFRSFLPYGRKDYYMMYLVAGSLIVSSGPADGSGETLLEPGQLFVFPPSTPYAYEPAGDGETRYYWVHFTGYGAAGLLSDCAIPVGAALNVGVPEGIEEMYKRLFDCFVLRSPCFDTVSAARFTEICAVFGDALQTENARRRSVPLPTRQLYTSLSYLHKNFSGRISVGGLARMEGLSVSRYRELFRELTGFSPTEYLTELRISRASELILHTELSMAEIAATVGYADPLYFSRVFTDRMGIPPSAYRKTRFTS